MSTSELRYTLRRLRKSPGFALVAVAILALGISGATTSFSILDTFLLRPLPYDAPRELVHLYRTDPQSGADQLRFSWQFVEALGREEGLVEDVGAYVYGGRNVAGGDAEPEHLMVAELSTGLLPLLGVEPEVGRTFRPEEGASGHERVVLLGYGVWQRSFGGRTDVVGQQLTLDGESHTVIGVMGRHFSFPFGEVRLWVPLITERGGYFWEVENLQPVVRLAEGVAPEVLRERATEIYRQVRRESEGNSGDYGVRVVPLRQALLFVFDLLQVAFWLGLVANGFLLLIICANLSNLMLNRAADRSRETALRAVLGASRSQLVGQLVLEGGVLVALGAALGVALAWWEVRSLEGLIPEALYRVGPLAVDTRALFFTLAVCLLTTLAFTLWPALEASRGQLARAVQESASSPSPARRRLRDLMVITQVSVAMVLLVGTSLLLQSALRMRAVDPGFEPRQVLTLQLRLPELQYPEREDLAGFERRVLDRLDAEPGLESAAFVNPLPLNFETYSSNLVIEGKAPRAPDERLDSRYHMVSAEYFETMGIPLLEGRAFSAVDDLEAEPVVIVDRTFAERHWPGSPSALGKRLRTGTYTDPDPPPFRTVVGVVGSTKGMFVHEDDEPTFYLPMTQAPRRSSFLVVRTQGPPEGALPQVRDAIWSVQPGLPLGEVRSMATVVGRSMAPWDGAGLGLVSLGFFALVLAALGLYGVVGYGVARRTREIGIRIALGAGIEQVRRLVLGKGLALTAIGVGLGLLLSLVLGRLLESLLYGVEPHDPRTLLATSAVLVAASVLACWMPARRATRITPQEALRYE